MNRRHVGASALAMCIALAACGDDGIQVEGDVLAEAEAQALASVITGETLANIDFSGAQASMQAARGPAAAAQQFEYDVSVDGAECPLGGTVSLNGSASGTVDDETGEGDITISVTEVHNDCMAQAEESDLIFTLNGAPDLGIDLTMSFSEEQFGFSGSFDGGVDWASDDGRSGTCPVNLTFEAEANGTIDSGSGSVSGSICGVSIEQSASWSPAT